MCKNFKIEIPSFLINIILIFFYYKVVTVLSCVILCNNSFYGDLFIKSLKLNYFKINFLVCNINIIVFDY